MRLRTGMMLALLVLASTPAAFAQDKHEAEEGEKLFKRVCFTCHTSEAGKNKIGPSLFGVVGRKAGTEAGFNYSSAMKESNITWNADSIDQYLTDPKKFVPGNKMAYAGVKKAEERKEIISYLSTLH
ncbi:cytochrome c [Enhydrobacter aerosaccus]|uniref:Cytochrome c n=1 Tax=Enhydrobacter aerosaccus TaxID=225324 RepID=A0A1T4SUX0_9HYPH|nr:cytochrome c family protein [Enhydrobacter aerosaccus]SKA31957.1 cytochrome c [Enhydrobacter aerosaccus]